MNQTVLESKQGVVSEIKEKFTNSSSTIVAEYRGLSVAEVTELRRALRAEGVELKVYKNTLASKAAEDAGYGDLKDCLTGPNALAFGGDETGAARVMAKFAKKHKALVLCIEVFSLPTIINSLSNCSSEQQYMSFIPFLAILYIDD